MDGTSAGLSGSAGSRTISELHEEVEALKHFFIGANPAAEITVDYVYDVPGLSTEILLEVEVRADLPGADRVKSGTKTCASGPMQAA